MARINFRLACTLLAIGTVFVLAVLPITRPLAQRQFWTLTGTYERRTGQDPALYMETTGMVDDNRITLLLRGYGQIPTDARANELATIAAKQKNPALWAHVIRQTSMAPVPSKKMPEGSEADRLRGRMLADLQLLAAREGKKLEPKNVFFDLAEASALGKLYRWDEIPLVMKRAQSATVYEDYITDEFRRRVEYVRGTLSTVLMSDLGKDWSMILFPHFASFKSLSRSVAFISSRSGQIESGMGVVHAGHLMEITDGPMIGQLVGSNMVMGSVNTLAGRKPGERETERELAPFVQKLNSEAKELGLTSQEGWTELLQWKKPAFKSQEGYAEMDQSASMVGVHALFCLVLIGILGGAMWLGTHIEPSVANVMGVSSFLFGASTLAAFTTEHSGPLAIMLWSSTLMFTGFLLVRLPGKQKIGLILAAIGAVLVIFATAAEGQVEMGLGIFLIWFVPFAVAYKVKKGPPLWVGTIFGTVVLGFLIVVVANGLMKEPVPFGHSLGETAITLASVASLVLPILAAYLMAFLKVNLQDSLNILKFPTPVFALIAAGWFAWGMREDVRNEMLWTQLGRQELPKKYQEIMAEGMAQ